jgi:hypothetical protein
MMSRIRFALVAVAALFAAGISTGSSALTAMPANGLNTAINTVSDVEQVRHRGWHHGWRRHWHPRRHHGWRRW